MEFEFGMEQNIGKFTWYTCILMRLLKEMSLDKKEVKGLALGTPSFTGWADEEFDQHRKA